MEYAESETKAAIDHVNIGVIFYCPGNSQWCIYNTQSKSDWLINTQSRVLQADWLILETYDKATLNINMPYWTKTEYALPCRCWRQLLNTYKFCLNLCWEKMCSPYNCFCPNPTALLCHCFVSFHRRLIVDTLLNTGIVSHFLLTRFFFIAVEGICAL